MADYFDLGASLPVIRKGEYESIPISSEAFLDQLYAEAPDRDRKLLQLLRLEDDHATLLRLLEKVSDIESEFAVVEDKSACFAYTDVPIIVFVSYYRDLHTSENVETQVEPEMVRKIKKLPNYLENFTKEYFEDKQSERPSEYFYADILYNYYLDYVNVVGNSFLRKWQTLVRNIKYVLASVTAKRFGLDVRKYLIGESELIRLIRDGEWQNIAYLEEHNIIDEILKITEQTSLDQKEYKIDELKWGFLDSVVFSDVFSIDAMMVYYLKLRILERW